MLKQLLELREFCDDFFSENGELSLKEEDWRGIENAVTALAPAERATVELQREQLTIGDFYGTWLKCRLEVSKMDSSIASNMAIATKRRENLLLGSDLFCAAIYMDPLPCPVE